MRDINGRHQRASGPHAGVYKSDDDRILHTGKGAQYRSFRKINHKSKKKSVLENGSLFDYHKMCFLYRDIDIGKYWYRPSQQY